MLPNLVNNFSNFPEIYFQSKWILILCNITLLYTLLFVKILARDLYPSLVDQNNFSRNSFDSLSYFRLIKYFLMFFFLCNAFIILFIVLSLHLITALLLNFNLIKSWGNIYVNARVIDMIKIMVKSFLP